MKRPVTYMLMALLGTTVLSSCSKDFAAPDMMETPDGRHNRFIISGLVTDAQNDKPLNDIKIRFEAYPQDKINTVPIATSEVYTTSEGIFFIEVTGFDSTPLHCILTATDPQTYYQDRKTNVIVSWSGPSYDAYNKTIVVNDCNFQLNLATVSASSLQSL